MVIEVKVNVIREVMTGTSKFRIMSSYILGGKPTTEGQKDWIHPLKTKSDGKYKYVEE